jgi:hypothetical protein
MIVAQEADYPSARLTLVPACRGDRRAAIASAMATKVSWRIGSPALPSGPPWWRQAEPACRFPT